MKKRKTKRRGSPRPKRGRGPRRGRCVVCGCTDDRGCEKGCAWANKQHTMCTRCDAFAWRATAKGARCPSKIPLFGLWVVDGGPKGMGHWLVDSIHGDDEVPGVFWDRPAAERACLDEVRGGLDVIVVELRGKARP